MGSSVTRLLWMPPGGRPPGPQGDILSGEHSCDAPLAKGTVVCPLERWFLGGVQPWLEARGTLDRGRTLCAEGACASSAPLPTSDPSRFILGLHPPTPALPLGDSLGSPRMRHQFRAQRCR